MATRRYFGRWSEHEDFAGAWSDYDYSTKSSPPVEGMATDEEVLFASYGGGLYDGDAFVLFRRDGKLYEVHGSHCSCYGLEGQWDPEETSLDALKMRAWDAGRGLGPLSDHDASARAAMRALLVALEGEQARAIPHPTNETAPMTKSDLLRALQAFVATRPGLGLGLYGDAKSYRADLYRVRQQRRDAERFIVDAATDERVTVERLRNALTGRLRLLPSGQIDYTQGQYYPTEYRAVVARVLADVLWGVEIDAHWETPERGTYVRALLRKRYGKRMAETYFD